MKRVVTIGGGTGTFVVLSALRRLEDLSLTAIVSSADDGGSAGRLRDAYGFLPMGDARQALVALSEDEQVMRDLFAYRFSKGDVAGHNLGNLFLTALTDLLGSDERALSEASRILRVRGRVIPASEEPAVLMTTLTDGTVLEGEHYLDDYAPERAAIASVAFKTAIVCSQAAKEAVQQADVIILGPGDLYASTIAPLLPSGMKEAVAAARGQLLYISNLFTKTGQTHRLSAQGHVDEVARYAGRAPDGILIHQDGTFDVGVIERYQEEGEVPVVDDVSGGNVVRENIAAVYQVPAVPGDPVPRSLARHDPEKLAKALHTFIYG